MDNKHIIRLQGFVCGYPQQFLLKEIKLEINTGKITGIIGPNGSGKTTLFRGITGELNIKKGTYLYQEHHFHQFTIRQKARKMAIVSQQTDAADIPVADYVLMGRLPYRKRFQLFESQHDFELAEHYMKLTDTFRLKNKLMCELSGGEQQLVAIARALTQEPELLLLDEPTAHLDIGHQVQILDLVQKLNHDLKITVLMIIHDLNLASEYCNYLIMMQDGAIHTQGKPQEVLTYQNIEDVYKTVVITQTNPLSQKPAIFVVSADTLNKNSNKDG
jgi:iron complex transport system ATP-binding protein